MPVGQQPNQNEVVRIAEHLSYYRNTFVGYEQVIFDGDQIENLKTVLQRALNCWPEAPKELFELDQILRFGEVLQPQSPDLFPKELDPNKIQLCRVGTHNLATLARGQQCDCPVATCKLHNGGLKPAPKS